MTGLPLEIQTRLSRSPLSHLSHLENYPTITTHEEYKLALHMFMSEFLLYHLLCDYHGSPNISGEPIPENIQHFLRIFKNMTYQLIERFNTNHNSKIDWEIIPVPAIEFESEIVAFIMQYTDYIKNHNGTIKYNADITPDTTLLIKDHFHKQDQDQKLLSRFTSVCASLKMDPKIKDVDSFLRSSLSESPAYYFIKKLLEKHSRILKLKAYPVITTLDQYKQAHQAFMWDAYVYHILCRYTYPKLDRAPHIQHFCKMLFQLGNAMIAWHNQEQNRDFVTGCTELTFIFGIVCKLTRYLQQHDDNKIQETYHDLTGLVSFVNAQRKAGLMI